MIGNKIGEQVLVITNGHKGGKSVVNGCYTTLGNSYIIHTCKKESFAF